MCERTMTATLQSHIQKLSDSELQAILRRDYFRRLVRYNKTDRSMQQKYGMTYEEFVDRNVVAKKNFAWEVESDSQDWEMAIDGIRSMQRSLREIDGQS